MALVSYSAFLPEVMPKVMGCADIVAINAVRNSAIDFCSRSLIWNETQDPVTVVSTDFPVDLEGTTGARVCKVLAVKFNGFTLSPVTQEELDNLGAWETNTGAPSSYFQPTPNTLQLYPLPDISGPLILRVAYTPSRASTSIEGFVHELYLEGIAAGALARLMREPGQQYSNPTMADYYDSQFEREVTKAKIDVNRSLTRGAPTVQMSRFA